MYSLDKLLLDVFKENVITIGLVLMFFKGLADISPWKWDNKIIELLRSMANGIRPINNKEKKK